MVMVMINNKLFFMDEYGCHILQLYTIVISLRLITNNIITNYCV